MSKAWSIVHVLSDNTVAGEADAVATTIASGTFTSSFACLWKNAANAPTMLGTLAQGETSAFRDIKGTNSEYLVVGYSDSGADASYHATLYSSYFAYIYGKRCWGEHDRVYHGEWSLWWDTVAGSAGAAHRL